MSKIRNLHAAQRGKMRNLILIVLLFVASVLGINYVIASNNHTAEFLVAAKDLPAGSTVAIAETAVQQVNLGASELQYLTAKDLPSSAYLLTPVRAGQLIAKSMVATAVIDERVPVVIDSAMGLAEGLVAGSSVDIWVTPITENKTFAEPFALVLGAEVAKIVADKELFANQNPKVEVWVPAESVPALLKSISSGDKLSLILRPTLAD